MQVFRGTAVAGVALAYALAAGGAAAGPGCGCRGGWRAGPTFNGAAPATFNWTQLSVSTSATGNSNQIIGSTGPITVTQTSGPILVYSGGAPTGSTVTLTLAGLLPGGTGTSATGSSGGGLVSVGSGSGSGLVSVGSGSNGGLVSVGSGSNGGLVQTNLGGVTANGVGTGPVTTGSGSAASSGGAGLQAAGGAISGPAITAPLSGAAGKTSGTASSLTQGVLGAGGGIGLGAGASVQLCTTCLTGGVGG